MAKTVYEREICPRPRMMSLSWDRGYEGVELFIKPFFDLIILGLVMVGAYALIKGAFVFCPSGSCIFIRRSLRPSGVYGRVLL